ncbi:hypothetical protein [Vitiosangium sp. GDMCC 1.1324]|nr:hypothetical protein [Vitiosangium sp. GDMCC 1.1324]
MSHHLRAHLRRSTAPRLSRQPRFSRLFRYNGPKLNAALDGFLADVR